MANNKQEKTDTAKNGDGWFQRQRARIRTASHYLTHELWAADTNRMPRWQAAGLFMLRLGSLAWQGIVQNKLMSRAAALSYGSLLALGPLIAIVVFVSGSFMNTDAEQQIKKTLLFIAPSMQEYVSLEQTDDDTEAAGGGGAEESAIDELISQIVEGANNIVDGINTRGSGAFGLIGGITLVFIAIQLLTAIETTFNLIWGVREGRPWIQRIISYWTLITLGTLLGLGSTALFSASALARMFEWVPMHAELTRNLLSLSPLLSYLMLVVLLTFIYSFFPNTSVRIRAALFGAAIVAILLFLNNYLSILYVHQVLRLQNLYGSLGIIPVLMVGMYFFWILVLLGGQLTYSIQNLSFLSFQHQWSQMSHRAQESIALVALGRVCERFARCETPLSGEELALLTNLPSNMLNESLAMLIDIGWISSSHDRASGEKTEEVHYQPARPLEKMTLGAFRRAVANYGEEFDMRPLRRENRILDLYLEKEDEIASQGLDDVPIAKVLREEDGSDSRAD